MARFVPRLAHAVLALAVAGCATTGTPVYKQDYEAMVVGQATSREVLRAFGQPTGVMKGHDDVEYTWEWSREEVKAASFVPGAAWVGAAGTAGTKGKVVAVFSKDGVLRGLRCGGSDFETSGGSIFQGYEVTGTQRARDNYLPDRPPVPGAGGKCRSYLDCKEGRYCLEAPGEDGGTCIGKGHKDPAERGEKCQQGYRNSRGMCCPPGWYGCDWVCYPTFQQALASDCMSVGK